MSAAGVTITIDMTMHPDQAEQTVAGIPAMFTGTVGFAGFRAIRVVRHATDPSRLLIVEQWNCEEDYAAYQEWRNRDGAMDAVRAALVEYRCDVWPTLVGEAAA